jgi:hypothetical protein
MEADLIRVSNDRGSTELGASSAIRQVDSGLTEVTEIHWRLGWLVWLVCLKVF